MKTNEGGAGFGTIGKERGKLLTAVVVAAVVLACCAMLLPVDADDTAPEIAYTEISPTDFLALDTDDDGVISLEDNYSLTGYVTVNENLKVITNGHSLKSGGDMFAIGVDGIDFEIDASTGGTMSTEVASARIIFGGGHEANITVTGGTYVSDWGFVLWGNNNVEGECDLVFKNATITAGTVGMWLSYGAINSATITGCNVDSDMGIYLATVQSSVISGCTINAITTGIEIKSGVAEIEDCTINSKNFLADDTVGMSQSGGSEAPITINNGYCSSAQVTYVDVTISNTTVTCEAEGYTPVVVTSYYDDSNVDNIKQSDCDISVTWEGASNSDVTFCPTKADATMTVNGFVAVDTAERLNAAVENGSNVVLAGDIAATVEIKANQNITIDLNGFTLDGGTASGTPAILNYGTTTIIDSSDDQSGVIQRSDASGGSYYVIDNHGILNITAGTITNNSGFPDKWQGSSLIRNVGTSADSNAILNISGGHIHQANFIAVKNDDFGVLNITGGLIEAGGAIGGNAEAPAVQNWHIAEITGGTINGPVMSCVWGTGADDTTYGDSSITIGGTAVINGDLEASYDTSNPCATKASITINDGAKVTAPGVYIAKGSINGTFELLDGGKIRILDNGTLTGTIIGPGGNTLTVTNLSSEDETTITAGSFVINGSWIGEMTVSGEDIVITGKLSEGAEITVKPQENGDPTNITWRDFDQNGASIVYQDAEGGEAEPSEVSNQIYENATIGGVTINTTYPEGGYVYDGEAQPLPTITVSVSEGQVSTSGFLQAAEEGDQGSFVAEDGLSYYWATSIEDATIWHDGATVDAAIDVGAYTVKYGYAVDGTIHVVECSWIVEKATLTITVDQDKVYDGQDMSYDITTDDVSGLGAGDSITGGTITTTGSDVKDYTVEGQDWTIDGLSTVNGSSNYEVVISSVSLEITKAPLTITVNGNGDYNGRPIGGTIITEMATGLVPGDSITGGSITTTGSDVGTYTVMDTDWTIIGLATAFGISNYEITYNVNLVISEAELQITGAEIEQKTYDSTAGATITSVTFEGLAYGESLTLNTDFTASGVFDNVNAGSNRTVSITVTALETDVMKNYVLPSEAFILEGQTIAKKVITITAATVDGKVYDGTGDWNVSSVTFDGLVGGEDLVQGTDYTYTTKSTYGNNNAGAAGSSPEYVKYADVTVTLADSINYTFVDGLTATLEKVTTSIAPITITEEMVDVALNAVEGGIQISVTISSGGLSPSGFTSKVTGPGTATTEVTTITAPGEYTVKVTAVSDTNWLLQGEISKTVDVQLYVAEFYTASEMTGGQPVYSDAPEQSVTGAQIVLPNANDVPEGYVLAGWVIGTDGTTVYKPGTYFDVPVSGAEFYAVYEKDDGTPVGPGPEPAAEPTVTIDMPDEFIVGVETEFSVSTAKGDTTGTVYVKGTGSFEGIPGVDYNIWYYETQDKQWHAWDGATFGPSTGFPLMDATSEFKVQFINAGAYDLTVQIVTADNGDVVCETAAVVNVPAEHGLGYHIQNAVDYVYADGGEYNADEYTYVGAISSGAGAITANYGYDYYEALIADLQKNPASMSEKTRDIMNDFARYMGALYRSADGDVGRVYFDGTEYVWKADADGAWLNGSNWRDADGKTLTEIVVQYIAQSQSTRIVMEVASNGISAEALTYSVQFDDAPIVVEQYTVQFQDQNGNVIETVTGLVSGSAVLLPRTIVVNDVTYDVDSWTIGTDVSISADIGYYFVDPVHATEGTITMVASVAEVQDPVTVTYYDGSQVLKIQVMYPGEFFEFPQVSLATGETFEGWYSDSELNTPAGTSLPEDATGTYSLYAKIAAAPQEATYEIVFMNGTQTLTYSGYTGLTEGTTVALPSSIDGVDASKFRLNGWFLEGKLPMTTYTVRGIDAVDGKITVYADIVQYSFEVTANTTENGTFTTFLQNGTLMISVFPDSGYAVDTVSVMAGDDALAVIKSSDTLYYVSIESDVTVSVTFKDVSGVQDPEDVSTMVDVSIGSLSDGVQVQLDALVGILPSDVDVSVTYYFQTEYEGMTGYGSVTVSNNEVQIPAENNGRWNVDFDLTSSQNYGSAYLGFATVAYTIGEVQYEFESLLTNIIHVPVTS